MKILNKQERSFAEDNHNILLEFLKSQALLQDDSYGIAAIAYIISVQKYLQSQELQQKYCFAQVSYTTMKSSLINDYRASMTAKRKADIDSISFEDLQDPDKYLFDRSGIDGEKVVLHKELIYSIKAELTGQQKEIFDLKRLGYTLREIAKIMDISEKKCYRNFDKIKKVVADVMENNR